MRAWSAKSPSRDNICFSLQAGARGVSLTDSKFKRQAVVLLGGLIVSLVILFLPQPEGMTESGQRLLAVVVLMAIWWMGEGTSITVTALLPLVLFPLLGILSSKEVAPNYSNHLVFLFLGGFMIALAMEKWNFHKRIALVIISLIGTNLSQIVLGFMVASAFLSMWISNTATTMMMLPVGMAVVRKIAAEASLNGVRNVESERAIQQSLGLVLMLGLAYSASIGGVGTLIGTPPNIVFAGFYKSLYPQNAEITFFQWMVMAVPLVCVFLPLVWIYLCRFVAPIPLKQIEFGQGGTEIIQNELKALGKMNRAEKIIAVVFVSTALLWIFRKPITVGSFAIPGWSEMFARPEYLHDATVAMAMGLLLLLLPVNFGTGMKLRDRTEYFVLDWDTVQKKVPWGILLLFGGGFALADGFGKTGLDQWIGHHLTGIAALPIWGVIFIICLGITFLTELTSNTATTTMILPIIGATAVAASYHPLLLMIPATLSASFAFMLPVATPPNAIVYSSGWVTIPKMSRAGLALNFMGAILVTAMVLLFVQRIFL
jgi:solute carrier family 13 (sodium-dependent dicarboxylate transporter), member 2/3/5